MLKRTHEKEIGIPQYEIYEFKQKRNNYVLLIPVIDEGDRIINELKRANESRIFDVVDIVICDGDSTDGSMDFQKLTDLNVNTLLVKKDEGKQGAQLRMGFSWSIQRGYKGIITIDGNNKDSIEDVPKFIEKLDNNVDFIQGSRFIKGGGHRNTPLIRLVSVKLIHAPIISLTAGEKFTDTTNAYRGYSTRYLLDEKVQPFRDIFRTYELLAYLSVRASQLGYNTCEVPVKREYPKKGKIPTKISAVKGNSELFKILILNMFGAYIPKSRKV